MVNWIGSEEKETCHQTGIISPDSAQPWSSGSITGSCTEGGAWV